MTAPRTRSRFASRFASAIAFAIVAVVAAATPVAGPSPAAAASCLRIVGGVFDAPGNDWVMPGLNGEYVLVRSSCSTTRSLAGWKVHDYGRRNTYTFPRGYAIRPGATVRLRTGVGTNTSTTVFWQRRSVSVWNNWPPERAYLRSPGGTLYSSWTMYVTRAIVGAGDSTSCSNNNDEATAKLLDAVAGTVFTVGDNAYDSGTASEYANCYRPTWGRHKARTRPTPGNHDYYTSGATGYFGYYGSLAGDPSKGYYAYTLGAWRVYALNSNCDEIGGCHAGSPQERWLRADLYANPRPCTLAYWHHARFSSGTRHGNDAITQPLWQALYDYRADLVLVGHDHHYERFAPQTASGSRDTARGLRQFVVGTGGHGLYEPGSAIANSEVRNGSTYGVLKLALRASSYEWLFYPVAGRTFRDWGKTACH